MIRKAERDPIFCFPPQLPPNSQGWARLKPGTNQTLNPVSHVGNRDPGSGTTHHLLPCKAQPKALPYWMWASQAAS